MSLVCDTCCEACELMAIGECGHRNTCVECYLRGVVFFGIKKCQFCREKMEKVIVTHDVSTDRATLMRTCIPKQLRDQTIFVPSNAVFEFLCGIVTYRCRECDPAHNVMCVFRDEPSLSRHLRMAHSKFLCPVCSSGSKVFPNKFIYYTHEELRKHRSGKRTDRDKYIPLHISCPFCEREQFFSQEELEIHCSNDHIQCQVLSSPSCRSSSFSSSSRHSQLCMQQSKNSFFADIDTLRVHQSEEHFICPMEPCELVFQNEFELRIHLKSYHGKKDSTHIDFSTFQKIMAPTPNSMAVSTPACRLSAAFSPPDLTPKSEVYIVEDPSGWSEEEITKRIKDTTFQMKLAIDGNLRDLQTFFKRRDQFLKGQLSARYLYDIFISKFGNENVHLFGQFISVIRDPKKRTELECEYRNSKEILKTKEKSRIHPKMLGFLSERKIIRTNIKSEENLHFLQFHSLFTDLFSMVAENDGYDPTAHLKNLVSHLSPAVYISSIFDLNKFGSGFEPIFNFLLPFYKEEPLGFQLYTLDDRDQLVQLVLALSPVSKKLFNYYCRSVLSQLLDLSHHISSCLVQITEDTFPELPSSHKTSRSMRAKPNAAVPRSIKLSSYDDLFPTLEGCVPAAPYLRPDAPPLKLILPSKIVSRSESHWMGAVSASIPRGSSNWESRIDDTRRKLQLKQQGQGKGGDGSISSGGGKKKGKGKQGVSLF